MPKTSDPTQSRKNSHIQLCLEESVEFYGDGGNAFGAFRFDHDALPEISLKKVDTSTTLLGKKLQFPIVIGAMTGGTQRARKLNETLARAAERAQVGFALGSQRSMLEDSAATETFNVRKIAPALPLLFGNLGLVQLNCGVSVEQVAKLVSDVKADALNFHLNALQEAIQPEGDTDFSNLISKLRDVIAKVKFPVFVKEVGSGISATTARKLAEVQGLAGVETAGVGGTSWSKIESLRTQHDIQKTTGELFARWGVPTAESVMHCREYLDPGCVVIASGGIRNGIELAKAIALGANAGAMALPFLKAAERSVDDVVTEINRVGTELRTAMFLVGASDISALRTKSILRARDFTADFVRGV